MSGMQATSSVAGGAGGGSDGNEPDDDTKTKEAAEETTEYEAPSGGGGVIDTINTNGKQVDFGHGGRRLEGSGLNQTQVNQRIADEISNMNLKAGDSGWGNIRINGQVVEFRYFARSTNHINVGTYYTIDIP